MLCCLWSPLHLHLFFQVAIYLLVLVYYGGLSSMIIFIFVVGQQASHLSHSWRCQFVGHMLIEMMCLQMKWKNGGCWEVDQNI